MVANRGVQPPSLRPAPSGGVRRHCYVSQDPYEQIRLAREHNNANVLSFGARFVPDVEAYRALDIFPATPFSPEPRHQRRIDKF